jgi:hypothetical protein
MTDKEILEQFGQDVVSDVFAKYISSGSRASGNFGKNMVVESTDTSVVVSDNTGYGRFIDRGRAPSQGSAQGNVPLRVRILQWMKDKGIQGTPYTRADGTQQDQQKADESLAFIFARAIHERGTIAYREGGTGVISDVITQQRVTSLTEVFGVRFQQRALSDVVKAFE